MSVKCPKCKQLVLQDGLLYDQLLVKYCDECKGFWIPNDNYENWQNNQRPQTEEEAALLDKYYDLNFVPSPYDSKAALCPDCACYLSRARVYLKTPFYLERCASCGGMWCDGGEWDILEVLGLHTSLQKMFSSAWQAKVRERIQAISERQALAEKLGPEVAEYIFNLAEAIEDHPHADCAATYLLRRFEAKRKNLKMKQDESI